MAELSEIRVEIPVAAGDVLARTNPLSVRLGAMGKRIFDVVLGGFLAAFLTPLIVLLAVGATVSLRAWPFFGQYRIGRRGRPFRIFKIRTLPKSAPAYADKYQIAQTVQVPPYCRWLRQTHLDELPQLYLVVLGRMSLVGPRPEMAMLHEAIDPDFAALRTSVRPGCSGPWQVGDASGRLIFEAPEYDRFYLLNQTLRLDLWLLWCTANSVVGIRRGRTLDEVPGWVLRRRAEGSARTIDLVGRTGVMRQPDECTADFAEASPA